MDPVAEDEKEVRIFMSYAIVDSDRLHVPEIAKGLMHQSPFIKVQYWEGWTGYPDGDIDNFMRNGIHEADIFIPFCTEAYINSKNCEKEWELAKEHNKQAIPLFEHIKFVPIFFQSKKGLKITDKSEFQIINRVILQMNAIGFNQITTRSFPFNSENEFNYFSFAQVVATFHFNPLGTALLDLLRERTRNKEELLDSLENLGMPCTLKDLNGALHDMTMVLAESGWTRGSLSVNFFLIRDYIFLRAPAVSIYAMAKKNQPTKLVAETYLKQANNYFAGYSPKYDDSLLIAQQIYDLDIFGTLTLLRNKAYRLSKFPRGGKMVSICLVLSN